jgi:co-chaperonin GroES (HSP10)
MSSIAITDDLLQRAKSIIGTKPVRAAGYRLKVFLMDSDSGLSAGEADIAPTLAKAGFVAKSNNQKAREDRGTDIALIVDVGPVAYTGEITGNQQWVKVGQVIRMLRYTGHQYEEPPGSGKRYGLINDEDVLGYYEQNVLEDAQESNNG